jgi:hypothetical protein
MIYIKVNLKSDYGRIEMHVINGYNTPQGRLKSDYGRIEISSHGPDPSLTLS